SLTPANEHSKKYTTPFRPRSPAWWVGAARPSRTPLFPKPAAAAPVRRASAINAPVAPLSPNLLQAAVVALLAHVLHALASPRNANARCFHPRLPSAPKREQVCTKDGEETN
ncbi:hypothetical protein CVT25_013275, partial [Psilocybe cyanescens]